MEALVGSTTITLPTASRMLACSVPTTHQPSSSYLSAAPEPRNVGVSTPERILYTCFQNGVQKCGALQRESGTHTRSKSAFLGEF